MLMLLLMDGVALFSPGGVESVIPEDALVGRPGRCWLLSPRWSAHQSMPERGNIPHICGQQVLAVCNACTYIAAAFRARVPREDYTYTGAIPTQVQVGVWSVSGVKRDFKNGNYRL